MAELPENILNSKILTEEHRIKLAEVEEVPLVNPAFDDEKLKNIFQYYSLTPDEMDVELHKYAAELLDKGEVDAAWQVLICE